MKNGPPLKSLLFLCLAIYACGKSSNGPSTPTAPQSSIAVKAGDSLITYSINLAYTQEVNNTHTTLISGQYADTSVKKGSLSIRLLGDTTGRFKGDSLLVTYTDGKGNIYYNTKDNTNFVQVDKFPKTYNGVVSGSFSFVVSSSAGSVKFSNGSIIAIYQK
jgi:hypothetical protein